MPDAFFLPRGSGQRFCIEHPAATQPVRGGIVYLHPFAEEMNKSRRMAGQQARALAAAGYTVVQIDLLGCGDSSGDFADASWEDWLADAAAAIAWLRQRVDAPLWLWGLRAGCLLAVEAAARDGGRFDLLLWQPVLSGKQFLQQFLRLKVAGEMLVGDGKGVMDGLRKNLAAGQVVEIAGYALAPGLASGLETADLAPPAGGGRVVWFEVASQVDATLSPAAQLRIEKWRNGGCSVEAAVVAGPAFWQTTEIEDAPALLSATVAAVLGHGKPPQ